ncbi:phosphodiesterase [Acrocarpospora corrugata]|uniref:Phosphodiesterase n=1 Tax=Acrocarpospora corrugata TaxID=35763 RepID=A0A5M3W4Y4_9ACTN|nr:nucleotide pyrophosphatase/phosphodiesterase family protein [Acrocarpospora corrugata]GES02323.1 phosphodiesterase [Acrocarpospora corrugata]
MPGPHLPAYGSASLSDFPGSLLAAFGGDAENTLGLAPASRVCLFLVDGMGAELLRAHPAAAPFLSAALGRTITAGFPSSTPTSLATLGTGGTPGEHGMIGIKMAVPGEGRLFNCLRWTAPGLPIDPDVWQPATTVYQRLAALDVDTVYVATGAFDGSGLTRAVYRGVDHRHAESIDERVDGVRHALQTPRTFVTVYYGDLDSTGHLAGWGSPAWLDQLAVVDRMAERLAESLPPGGVMYVTADHGMVNATDKFDLDQHPELMAGVSLLGGEPRARHVYTEDGAASAVEAAWREALDGRAWVVSREEAVDSGWFGGSVRREWLPRIGDVVAVPYGGCVVIPAEAEKLEWGFTGYHGSLTVEELNVPLLEIHR